MKTNKQKIESMKIVGLGIISVCVLGLVSMCSSGCSTLTPEQKSKIGEAIEFGLEQIKPTATPEPQPTVAPLPEPEPEPRQPDGLYSVKGSQRLLIKPVADEGGGLVVLLPAGWNNIFKNVWIETESARFDDTGRRNINADLANPDKAPYNSNGNRRHIWFRVSGATIGNGVLVVELEDGTRRLNRDFSVRTEPVEK